MGLPKREYYTLQQAAKRVSCDVDDLLHYAAIGVLQLCVYYESTKKFEEDSYFYADISDELLDELNGTPENVTLTFSSKFNVISMDSNAYFYTKEDGQPCWADYAKGWFAISHTELTLPAFEIQKKAEVFQLHQPRNNVMNPFDQWGGNIKGFEPGAPFFYKARVFTIDDFVIMDEELTLLMNGGQKVNVFGLLEGEKTRKNTVIENVGNKTFTSMAKLIKSLLFMIYKDEDILNNPRKHFDNAKSEINKDFDALGLNLPAGKTIDKWLKGIDLDRR
ncbi:TPA: hypothetical protein U2Q57_005240 [Citrobacter farmeri]|nr:hypothetical protein [Citrobacter farmeri]HEM8630431.1 hypothetical protein [Citrobacter farmeri]